MSDHSLCGSPDRLPMCATCLRNPQQHPYSRDNPWQSYFSPPLEGDNCTHYWPPNDAPKEMRK
jgi:hypothetical protein